jgi:hypothetical protein
MRILIDRGSDPAVAGTAINARVEDVRIAACLLVGAASAAEAELAAHAWSPGVLATARPLGKIIKACNELEAALAGRPAVNTAHLPPPSTLRTIAAVETARSAMPDERTQATIARVSKTIVSTAIERSA